MDVRPPHAAPELSGHERHEQRLAAALRELLQQADISDYRDSHGHVLTHNAAYLKAEALVQEFGVTHDELCQTLDDCDPDGDLTDAAQRIFLLRLAKEDAAKAVRH